MYAGVIDSASTTVTVTTSDIIPDEGIGMLMLEDWGTIEDTSGAVTVAYRIGCSFEMCPAEVTEVTSGSLQISWKKVSVHHESFC